MERSVFKDRALYRSFHNLPEHFQYYIPINCKLVVKNYVRGTRILYGSYNYEFTKINMSSK